MEYFRLFFILSGILLFIPKIGYTNAKKINEQNIKHPVLWAIQHENVEKAEDLISKGYPIDLKDSRGSSLLHLAAERGYTNIIDLILTKDPKMDVNIQDKKYKTPLHLAVENGHIESVELLIEKGANPNIEDNLGRIPLHFTVDKGPSGIEKKVLSENTENVNGNNRLKNDSFIWNSLNFNAISDYTRIATILLTGGDSNFNKQDKLGVTPLHLAVKNKHINIVKVLFTRGVDVGLKDNLGKTALHYGGIGGYSAIVDLIINKKEKVGGHNTYILGNKASSIVALQPSIPDNIVNMVDDFGRKAIHYAIENGHVNLAIQLLKKTTNLKKKDAFGGTLLHFAVKQGYTELVNRLLDKNVDVNVRDSSGMTPLHLAAQNKLVEESKILIKAGADVEAMDGVESKPIQYAIQNRDKKLIKILKKAADVENRGGCKVLFLKGR